MMHHNRTTPVPNVLFDTYLKELKSAELKVLLVIIRQTLGWADSRAALGRKERDWISGSQLQALTGSSRRAISYAIEVLVAKELIEVLDEAGNLLTEPEKRKGKQRLYYRPSILLLSPVDNMGKNPAYPHISSSASVDFAEDLRKKRIALVQKMRITKETLQN
jgi:hypothetical protein